MEAHGGGTNIGGSIFHFHVVVNHLDSDLYYFFYHFPETFAVVFSIIPSNLLS